MTRDAEKILLVTGGGRGIGAAPFEVAPVEGVEGSLPRRDPKD